MTEFMKGFINKASRDVFTFEKVGEKGLLIKQENQIKYNTAIIHLSEQQRRELVSFLQEGL